MVRQLDAEIAQQAAVIEQMRDSFREIAANSNAHTSHLLACEALNLQPCPEVLNKIRADAVAEFCADQRAFEIYKAIKLLPQRDKEFMENWVAQRIEKGEA